MKKDFKNFYNSGEIKQHVIDTPQKMAKWKPDDMREILVEFVERTGFEGIAPLPKEL
jgi:hypothetical protein